MARSRGVSPLLFGEFLFLHVAHCEYSVVKGYIAQNIAVRSVKAKRLKQSLTERSGGLIVLQPWPTFDCVQITKKTPLCLSRKEGVN